MILPALLWGTSPSEVVDYWLGPPEERVEIPSHRLQLWFSKNSVIDDEIRSRFGAAVEAASKGELDSWLDCDEGTLALLILLDQFPRNLYRGSGQAFAADAKAREVAWELIDSGCHASMTPAEMLFTYLPLEHS